LIIKHEDIAAASGKPAQARKIFEGIEAIYGADAPPPDVTERVTAGLVSDLSASYVSRAIPAKPPDWLPAMIECLVPGVRRFLGYEDATRKGAPVNDDGRQPDSQTIQRVVDAVAKTFRADPSRLNADTTADDVNGWDSVSHAMLIMELEDTFHVTLEFAETVTAHNLGDLAALVERKARS
jgi:acyl carrier protein